MQAVYGATPPPTLQDAQDRHNRLRADLLTAKQPSGCLRLHDLGELIRRDAQLLGLSSETEVKVGVPPGKKRDARIDWVLRGGNGPLCAIEIEGRNVVPGSLEADHWKLTTGRLCAGATWPRLVVLFSVAHHLRAKGERNGPGFATSVKQQLDAVGANQIKVLMDVDVWNGRLIELLWPLLPGAGAGAV